MAEVKWIKITTNIFDDEKIKIIDTMPARDEIIVVWFKLLALAGKVNQSGMLFMNSKIAYTPEMLSAVFNRELNVVKLALSTFNSFGMIEIEDNEIICISNWDKHQNIDGLEKIRLQTNERVKRSREKKKTMLTLGCNATSNATVTKGNAIEVDIEEEVDINDMSEIVKTKTEKLTELSKINSFFEECWALYPKKEGKGKVTDKTKKETYLLGDRFKECITKYKKAKKGTEKQFLQMGSTFWNSGYIDYLTSESEESRELKKPVVFTREDVSYG